MALRLARECAAVAAVSRTAAQVEETAPLIKADGDRAIGFTCNIGVPGNIEAAIARTERELGSVDILVNNARNAASCDDGKAGEDPLVTNQDHMASGPYAALAGI